ncbi:extracellular solute-binding protein [Anaerosacchariphilus polymeriproducens]|uniref:Extracellular solute-binding protein n=1 Tax=Anaerosacchariphilus polymeriproducens TaxID=1812858 RepID=A0A371AZQ9_9FIRM|nr:extracellular solute-binding protein [Anaerosacchariphilus polymeriproducens]RDU25023.1 extracellular solute-binding protein [Anaerosacchariphilus polymeriproducens]
MRSKMKYFLTVAMIFVTLSTGCGRTKESNSVKVDVPTKPFGSTIVYDPAKEINDGKKITIELWEWGSDETFQKLIDGYTSIHPNVTIKLVSNPWDDYWTKLPLALQDKNGPVIFNIHNSYHENIINYCAPYEISVEDLEKDFNDIKPHVKDGKVYYIDFGIMTGSVYYNKAMWKAAGLADNDIPKTWDEFRNVAKKLTIKDGKHIVQAGINFNTEFYQTYLLGLNYQLGQNLFSENGKTATINTPAMKKVMNMLLDIYNVDGSGSKDFGTSGSESFGQGQSAMTLMWGHYKETLQNDYPDIDYGVFEIPSFDEKPYAYNRYNGESTFGINKNSSKEAQAVAQDVIKYFLANDEILKEFNLARCTFPTKKSLTDDSDILAHPAMSVLAEHIDRYIWPGPMPAVVEESLKIAGQDIMYNGSDIETALQKAENSINEELKSSDFTAVENLYKYAKQKK